MIETFNGINHILDEQNENCVVCGKPKTMIHELFGKVGILCDCDIARENAQKEKDQKEQLYHRCKILEKAQTRSRMHFSDDNGESDREAIGRAKAFVSMYDEYAQKGRGLLFYGKPGTGKTFLLSCIVNALNQNGVYSIMVTQTSLYQNAPDELHDRDGRKKYIWAAKNVPILAIDEFNANIKDTKMYDFLLDIISERIDNNRPILISTNHTVSELATDAQDTAQSRIFSRLATCNPVRVAGNDLRRKSLAQDMELLRGNNT